MNIAYGYHVIHTHVYEDHFGKVLLAAAWALSMTMMTLGLILISWHTFRTPKVARDNGKEEGLLLKLFYALVDAGCLTLVVDIITVAFGNHDPARGFISLAVLGQISVSYAYLVM